MPAITGVWGLEAGARVRWTWEMYGVSAEVKALKVIPGKLISTQWGDPATTVDYVFTDMGRGNTYVVIRNYGFKQTGDELIRVLRDNTAGFTSVLDGLKAWLEHGIRLNLVADKFPDKRTSEPKSLDEWQREV